MVDLELGTCLQAAQCFLTSERDYSAQSSCASDVSSGFQASTKASEILANVYFSWVLLVMLPL